MNPLLVFERLFFAVFGQTTYDELIRRAPPNSTPFRPLWTDNLFKIVFGIYMLVSVVVLINLLIAMMSDTYQRIQAQSDIEWKFGLSKLIRSMHRTTTAPSPINLITTWLFYLVDLCKQRSKFLYVLLIGFLAINNTAVFHTSVSHEIWQLCKRVKASNVRRKKRQSLVHLMDSFKKPQSQSPRSKAGAKWLSKVKKGQVAPKESVALSVAHMSPFGSQLSFNVTTTRIEHVTDWEAIAKRYRALVGHIDEVKEHTSENEDEEDSDNEVVIPNSVGPPITT